jgi:hypothetical protein
MKKYYSLLFPLAVVAVNAQRSQKTLQIFGLKRKHILTFNQSAYNKEWLGGGTSNIAGNFSLNYDFNYKKRSSCLG